MTEERRRLGYEPCFDIDYKFGEQGELFVTKIIESLGTGRVEVKNDARFSDTGNVYVECQCLRRGKWHPSGIATTDAEFWVFVLANDTTCVAVTTEYLKSASRAVWQNNPDRRKECPRGSHPTRGVAMSVMWLLRNATRVEVAS